MPDASATAGPPALDIAFVSSLLLHPSRRALLVLDAGGRVLAGNDRARDLVAPGLETELRKALAQAMAQLAGHPGREIHYRHEQPGLTLDCTLRAVVDAARW